MNCSFLKGEAAARNVPEIFTDDFVKDAWDEYRERLIKIFADKVFGVSPVIPLIVDSKIVSENKDAFAGKATHRNVELSFSTPKDIFSFPIDMIISNDKKVQPLIIFLSFHPYKESYETPIEEIIDSGYSLVIIHYETISKDNADMQDGLAGMFDRNDTLNEWGKIGVWAYAVSRVMDYAQTQDYLDTEKIACAGHSRLGRTALWCAAQDTRFAAVFANNSGCSGAALSRGKKGERIKDIYTKFPYWFCQNYSKYIDKEDDMPFDQYYLLAAIAPRLLYISSASEDEWADPKSEYLSAVLASEAYKVLNTKGLIGEDRYPRIGDVFHDGNIGYHMRKGTHFLSRYDWQNFINFFNNHIKQES